MNKKQKIIGYVIRCLIQFNKYSLENNGKIWCQGNYNTVLYSHDGDWVVFCKENLSRKILWDKKTAKEFALILNDEKSDNKWGIEVIPIVKFSNF